MMVLMILGLPKSRHANNPSKLMSIPGGRISDDKEYEKRRKKNVFSVFQMLLVHVVFSVIIVKEHHLFQVFECSI